MTLWKSDFVLKQSTIQKTCNHCLILNVISLIFKFFEEAKTMGEFFNASKKDPAL